MDDYHRRFEEAVHEMERAGIKRSEAVPTITRALRKLGLRVRPPLYFTFWQSAAFLGIGFATPMGLFDYFIGFGSERGSAFATIITACVVGAFFGVSMALFFKWLTRHYVLSDWNDL